jgi:prepilin-type N-terminal cleavage/methylation domain-containing protein
MRKQAGFTLIEILIALLILAIGMAAVVGLVIGAQRISNSTSDRNIARALISEAVADIERMHLITKTIAASPADEGLLLETRADLTVPNIHSSSYSGISFESKPIISHVAKYCGMKCLDGMTEHPSTAKTFLWPWANDPKFLGGATNSTSYLDTNYGYWVIYRLERHPDWVAQGDESIKAGLYALTLTAYRDVDRKGGRFEQLNDPMVVYLRDKKVRVAP